MVQIHSPRPFFSHRIMRVGTSAASPLVQAILRCAQYCAQPAFQPLQELHPRKRTNRTLPDCPACQAVIAYLQRDSELRLYAYKSRN
jgi:hypothetical protein